MTIVTMPEDPPLTDPAAVPGDPESGPSKLVVLRVTKEFRSRKTSTLALDGVDLHVDDGELV